MKKVWLAAALLCVLLLLACSNTTGGGPTGSVSGGGTSTSPYADMVKINAATITGSDPGWEMAYGGYDWEKGAFVTGRTVTLSSYNIAKYETTWALWNEVKTWAGSNGYTFANAGVEGHGTDGTGTESDTALRATRPVTTINWRDAIVWCNAYSEWWGAADGGNKGTTLTPFYYTDSGFTTRLRTSTNNSSVNTTEGSEDKPYVKPDATGFRLPTEAEWEFAARGASSGVISIRGAAR